MNASESAGSSLPPPLPPEPVVSVRNLERRFDSVHAVRGVSFDIQRGQVVGFIGANGAGKTTTMRMMATLEIPTAGRIRICGYDVVNHPTEVRRHIGWMPDSYGTYGCVTVHEYLDFYARAFGFRKQEREQRVAEVMEFTDLAPIADRMMDKLSKGMAQRLCLGRTLLHDPEVMILDEPAAGLDPKARLEFKHLVRLLAGEGKTIFISSHILSELSEMCDTLLFIDAGKIIHYGAADTLLEHDTKSAAIVDVQVAGDPAPLADWAKLSPGVELIEVRKDGARLSFDPGGPETLSIQLRRMLDAGIPVVDFHRSSRRLEDAFVEILTGLQS